MIPAPSTVLWSSWIGWGLLTLALPLGFAWPTPKQWIMLVGLGVLASLGQWMTILSFRYAQASLLMPFIYVQLVWVAIGGYAVFGEVPDRWTVLGAGIIVASGLYTAHRERVRAREKAGRG